MKYRLECDGEKVTETLELNGKEYRRNWKYEGNGVTGCDGGDFADMLECDGVINQEILNEVYDKLDGTFFASDVLDVCSLC